MAWSWSGRDITLNGQLRRALGTLAALVVFTGAAGVANVLYVNNKFNHLVDAVQPLADHNDALLQDLTNAETGVLGYVATGDPQFLEPYTKGRKQYHADLVAARELAPGVGDATAGLNRLSRAAQRWFHDYAEPAIEQRAGDPAAPTRAVSTLEGKRLFDRLRAIDKETSLSFTREIAAAKQQVQNTRTLGTWLVLALSVAATILALALSRLVARRVSRPLETLQRTLRKLTAGDRDARAPANGPPEVVAVARDVNALADENNILQAQQEDRLRSEQLGREIASRVRASLDVSDILAGAVDLLGPNLHVDRVYVRIVDEHGVTPVIAEWTATGVTPASEVLPEVLPRGSQRVFTEMLRNRASLVVRDIDASDLSPGVVEALKSYGVGATIGCPLDSGSDQLGLIGLHIVGRTRDWTDGEVMIVESVAHEISIALRHARAYELQRAAVARLEELVQERKFISTLSHELRTPLTSIMGYLEILEDGDAGELNDKQRRVMNIVARNGGRLLLLIEDLLTLARIDSGSFRMKMGPVDVADIVGSVADALGPMAAEHLVRVVTAVAPSIGIIEGDAEQLERVVLNLVNNAVKFTQPGGTVSVMAERDLNNVRLVVRDAGIGIPKDEQDRLFTRFFRSSTSQELAVQGTGLGLSIVKTVIDQHGGTVSIESEPNVGTAVTVVVPISQASVTESPTHEEGVNA